MDFPIDEFAEHYFTEHPKKPVIYMLKYVSSWNPATPDITEEQFAEHFLDAMNVILDFTKANITMSQNLGKDDVIWVSKKAIPKMHGYCGFFCNSKQALLLVKKSFTQYAKGIEKILEDKYGYKCHMQYYDMRELTKKYFEEEKETFSPFSVFVPEDVKEDPSL